MTDKEIKMLMTKTMQMVIDLIGDLLKETAKNIQESLNAQVKENENETTQSKN